MCTVEPRYNKPLYNKVLGITNDVLQPDNSKIHEKKNSKKRNLGIANTFCQSLSSSLTVGCVNER